MENKFKIDPKDENLTWQVIHERVKKGFQLQENESLNLTDDEILKYNDSIIIAPDYQREYRSSITDESSLIESALLEIPIPPIFLASHKIKGVQVLNVVDGQHRLRAFYRFFENSFALKELNIVKELDGYFYKDLEIGDKVTLLSRTISAITFRNFPGKEFELEIFNRYNKGTKPLTGQEIRNAVFNSRVNILVNSFCDKLYNRINQNDIDYCILKNAYAFSKDRFLKKTVHENIFVILSILEYGVEQSYINDKGTSIKINSSPKYAENYMYKKSLISDDDNEDILNTNDIFERFNNFIIALSKITEYPFSKEIYGYSSKRGNKFQVSISMILAGIFRKMISCGFDFDMLDDQSILDEFGCYLKNTLNNSYLENPEYKASTTNPDEISLLVEKFNFNPTI